MPSNNNKKYRCTWPEHLTLYKNGELWASRSYSAYGNKKGWAPTSLCTNELNLGSYKCFDTLEELVRPWKCWKEKEEKLNAMFIKNGQKPNVDNFFYNIRRNKESITIHWGWNVRNERILLENNLNEFVISKKLKITDIKVKLNDTSEIPK